MHSTSARCRGGVALCALMLFALGLSAALGMAVDTTAQTAALCEPGYVEKMPAHIRKVCQALESSAQLSNSLFTYLHNQKSALLYQPDDLAMSGSGIDKRTDVDHVFLRFGRRR